MSTAALRPRVGRFGDVCRRSYERFVAAAFGDRIGLAIFLGGLWFVMSYWRVGVFITDTYTVANTLVAVADGHLWIDEIVYGPGPTTPGMHVVDGTLYGRNYGHVALAIPFLGALRVVTSVADPRVALVALWCFLGLGAAVQVGALFDRRRAVALLGSGATFGVFGANLALATPLGARWLPLVALQLATMTAAALVGVVAYRLVSRIHARRAGALAGLLAVAATPVGFWASLPKRHALTAVLVLCTVYCLYRSRAAPGRTGALRFRAIAYAPVGLLAWVHAPEALVVFVGLLAVDLPTARANDPRSLAVVSGVFLLSLAPFLVTNALISGNPVQPPRLLPDYPEDAGAAAIAGGAAGTGGGGGLVGALTSKVVLLASLYADGATVAVQHPERLSETFVRSGYLPRVAAGDAHEAINLSMLESAPVLGGLLGVGVLVLGLLRRGTPTFERVREWIDRPAGTADALGLTVVAGLTLVYLPRLPLHAQVTVRYLLALFPLGVYGLVRLPCVRRVVRSHPWTLVWAWTGVVLVGGQLQLAWLALTGPALGEAVQVHAWIGLGAATVLGAWTIAALSGRRADRIGAICLGVAAGAGTVFLLVSGGVYFAYAGEFAIPLVRRVAAAAAF